MTGPTALDSFLDKWRERWPEWPLAETFVPTAQRQLAVAWFALLQEFEDAMNIAGDPLPANAKLGWWSEELRDWSRRRSRHPLGRLLEPHAAPWAELAEALPVLGMLREPWPDLDAAFVRAQPLAHAIAGVEAALFNGRGDEAAVQAIGAQWLSARMLGTGQGDDLPGLLERWPARVHASLPRRLWASLARDRVRAWVESGGVPRRISRWRLLWRAWNAARG
ncbi:MAG TPA: phytoene/squalene synthase family protein [Pseudoxanthomonas sp.]|nr:phytoene/squalene synthase family protein [Pseudoxanthomonas sp.]